MTHDEYAAIIRSMIEHENTLLHHRMSWMWTVQGLLIAAVGIMWNIHDLLILLICGFGVISSISVGASLRSALRAIDSLVKDWELRISGVPDYDGPRVIGSPRIRRMLQNLYPWNMLPWFMVLVWALLAVGKFTLNGAAMAA